MRKLKLQMQMTVDGFVGGLGCELVGMTWDWDDGLKSYVNQIHEAVDCILLGRKITDAFINHWEAEVAKPGAKDYIARKMVDTRKIVFSRTLRSVRGKNAELAKGDLVAEITQLKAQPGQDIIVYGGVNFVSSLVKTDLIDEYNFFVNPAVLGKGMTVFEGLEAKRELNLVKSRAFDCGIVLLCYEPKRG